MVNVLFNDFSYEILPKQLETFDKYCKILQWGRANPTRFLEEFVGLRFTDHLKYVLLSSWIPSNVVWVCSRSTGKLLPLYTKVPILKIDKNGSVSEELIEVGNLKEGDTLIGMDGKPTKIIQLHPIMFENIWEMELENGVILESGPEHLWSVYDFGRNTNKSKAEQMEKIYIKETLEIAQNLRCRIKHPQYRYALPISEFIDFNNEENKEYEIEPYILGLWLSDGSKQKRIIACDYKDIDEQIEILKSINKNGWIFEKGKVIKNSYGYIKISHPDDTKRKKVFIEKLKKLKLYNNKHIPEEYFYGSYNQRLLFIQGLFDADGNCPEQGNFEFVQKDEKIAKGAYRIIREMGVKSTLSKKNNQDVYRIYGTTDKLNPFFRISRKMERTYNKRSPKMGYYGIHDIRKTEKVVPMRCITVDNDSGTFLMGENYMVTHNSFMSAPLIMARSLLIPSHNTYIMAPTGSQALETFTKLENLAKNNIASVIGVSSFFLDECVRINSKADPFTHDKSGYTVSLFNGSTVNTLNSVAKNIVGIRSNFNVYDEGGKYFASLKPLNCWKILRA